MAILMTATSAILAGGIAVLGGSCALVGAVAVLATPFNLRRDNRARGARSEVADCIAAAIMLGEQDARDATHPLALATGCAFAIIRPLAGDDPRRDLWNMGLGRLGVEPRHPDTNDPLRLAVCLQYCMDLAHDRLHADGRSRDAIRVWKAMGAFVLSGVLDGIDGWTHLEAHRRAGMRELAGETFGDAPSCPFCGIGVYDQTRLGCDQCATAGELARTVPAFPLPKRTAPDLRKAAQRARDIEARALAELKAGIR